jgi:hypothetical protein
MAIVRGFATPAFLAGLALGLATPAAAAPVMNGHYIETETNSAGQSTTDNWNFTPCGDGCANITGGGPQPGPLGQARIVNGQWAVDITSNVDCGDGRHIRNAGVTHYTWDPNTLGGTGQFTYRVDGCFHPAGYSYGTTIQLKRAS